jgi:hypothetical protein
VIIYDARSARGRRPSEDMCAVNRIIARGCAPTQQVGDSNADAPKSADDNTDSDRSNKRSPRKKRSKAAASKKSAEPEPALAAPAITVNISIAGLDSLRSSPAPKEKWWTTTRAELTKAAIGLVTGALLAWLSK